MRSKNCNYLSLLFLANNLVPAVEACIELNMHFSRERRNKNDQRE